MIKDLEKKYKDLQIKYDADEHAWTRIKKDMTDKQRKVRYKLISISRMNWNVDEKWFIIERRMCKERIGNGILTDH